MASSLMASSPMAAFANGILRIDGTDAKDNIIIRQTGARISVEVSTRPEATVVPIITAVIVHGNLQTRSNADIAAGPVAKIVVNALGNDDRVENLTGVAAQFFGGSGNDTLIGGRGNDELNGEAGIDTLEGKAGNDTLTGGAQNDTYIFADLSLGTDTVVEVANGGSDTLDFSGFGAKVSVDLDLSKQVYGTSNALILASSAHLENVKGSAWDDTLKGNGGANRLEGNAGNDTLEGRGGADVLEGGEHDDQLTGGGADDTYVFRSLDTAWYTVWYLGWDTITEMAGDGADWLDFSGFRGPVSLDLNKSLFGASDVGGYDLDLVLLNPGEVENVRGTAYADTIYGTSRANILEGNGSDDVLFGGDGEDELLGQAGRDYLDGGLGRDTLTGGSEADFLFGDIGNDTLSGGAGNDTLFGGPGANTLIDSGANTLTPGNDWYDNNLEDAAVRSLARYYHRDNSLSRAELLTIFDQVGSAAGATDVVSGEEYRDLLDLVNRSDFIHMAPHVRVLAAKTVISDPANAKFQGEELGNLSAGCTGSRLNKLVDKWFMGLDRPIAVSDSEYMKFHGQLFVNGPEYTDIAQNVSATCFFLSPLAGLARQAPNDVRDMFIDNGDGTFTVRFFEHGQADYVTVDRWLAAAPEASYLDDGTEALPAGRTIFAGVGRLDGDQRTASDPDAELWVALAEKAYAQWNEIRRGANSYDALNGGLCSEATEHITGRHSDFWLLGISSGSDYNLLGEFTGDGSRNMRNYFDQGKVITVSTTGVLGDIDPRLMRNHVLAVVKYEQVGPSFMFTLRDPREGVADIVMSWESLKSNCSSYFWA
jgi:Ca2+-binding RTX toxin-like protein